MITVYLVDDHPFVREGLKTFLNSQKDIEVVGEAGNGEKALKDIKEIQPEVVIVDLHLPGMDGVQLTRELKKISLNIQIVILSSYSDDQEVIAAIDAGALSYLMKDSPPEKLKEAIYAAREGEPVLHPRIARKLMKQVTRKDSLEEPLTSREREVLRELVKGYSNKEIGERLFISDKTVKTHVSSILRKLGVKDRTQAAIKALEKRLIDR